MFFKSKFLLLPFCAKSRANVCREHIYQDKINQNLNFSTNTEFTEASTGMNEQKIKLCRILYILQSSGNTVAAGLEPQFPFLLYHFSPLFFFAPHHAKFHLRNCSTAFIKSINKSIIVRPPPPPSS